jgi:chromosome segregation ATPase
MTRRGLRELATIQGLRRSRLPQRREQAVGELARLEHERTRLQRELEIWRQNQARTEERLHRCEARVAQIQQALGDQPAAPSSAPQPRSSAWDDLTFEY